MAMFNTFQGDFTAFSYAVVYNSEGKPQPVSRFWKMRPAVLVFLRHFGCVACRSHAQDVWNKREHLQKGGAEIIFIGNGAPSFIDTFRAEFGLGDAPIYTDPSLKTFALAGFKRSIMSLACPQTAVNMASLMAKGHRNGNPFAKGTGSNLQMGGVIVVHPGDRVSYHYISEAVGDVPDPNEINGNDKPGEEDVA